METRKAIGAIFMLAGAVLIVAHLVTVRDLVQSGVYLDESGEDGESVVATHMAMPMGAGSIGVGILVLASGFSWKRDEEDAATARRNRALRKYAPVAITLSGLFCIAWHVVMLRSLTLHVEAFERRPGFDASGPEFEAEKARAHLELERVNAVFYLGMAIAFAGLGLGLERPAKRETESAE